MNGAPITRRYALRRGIAFYSTVTIVLGALAMMLLRGQVELSAIGVVTGEELRIAAGQGGRIERLHFNAHEAFRAGDLMVTLHNDDLASQEKAFQREIQSLESLIQETETRRPTEDPAQNLLRDLEGYRLERSQASGRLQVAEMAILLASTTVEIKSAALERARNLAAEGALVSSEVQSLEDELRLAQLELHRAQLERDVEKVGIEDIDATIERTSKAISEVRVAIPDSASSLRARLEEKRTELREVESKLSALKVYAPYDGVVVHSFKHDGELAIAGETIYLTVVGQKRWIQAHVDPRDAEHLLPEMQVEIVTGLNSARTYYGHIQSISPLVEAGQSSEMGFLPPPRSIAILIIPQGGHWQGLIPGQEVTCRIAIDRSYINWFWERGDGVVEGTTVRGSRSPAQASAD